MEKNSDLKNLILKTLDSNKALDIISIDLKNKSSMADYMICLLYTSPSPRDVEESRMPSSA